MHGCQVERLRRDFDDILQIKPTLEKFLGGGVTQVLDQSVTFAHQFLDNNKAYLQQREKNGFVRDLHGDLHSGNIFLTQPPTLFDCIEFDDHLRQIDVLNEIAFLLMDLEVFGRTDLSRLFVELYQKELPCELSAPDEKLLEFYKFYRANVRLKVQALRGDAMDVEKVRKYFDLYQMYLEDLTKDGG